MKNAFFYLILLGSAVLSSCDEGDIPEKAPVLDADGRAAKVTADVTGLDSWPSTYTIAVAAFAENNQYASFVKDLKASTATDGTYTFYNIPEGVKTLEICAVNSLRRRIATFAQMDISEISDTIRFDAGQVNVGMFQALQDNIFTARCAACHGGGSGAAAANLHLGVGRSYADLVGVASTVSPTELRVEAGNADSSVLYKVLATDFSDSWSRPHSNFLSTDEDQYKLRMLRDWINNGAKE